jgi:hypothetical protein
LSIIRYPKKNNTTFQKVDLFPRSYSVGSQHAYEEGHKVSWDEDRILEIETNSRYRKYKESAYMAFLTLHRSRTFKFLLTPWAGGYLNI